MKNRYHISIISVLLLYVNTVFAQSDHQMDSLQQVAQQAHAAGNRVEEAKAYLSISKIWDKQEQNQQALENVERALAVLPTGYPTLLGELIHQKSRILFFSGDPASSLTWMDSSYQLLKNCNNLALLNPALMFYGSVLSYSGQYSRATEILRLAEDGYLKEQPIRVKKLLNIYTNQLHAYLHLSDYTHALEAGRKGIDRCKNTEFYEESADLNYNVGVIYHTLKYYKDAEYHYLKALELNQKGNIRSGIIKLSSTLGQFYASDLGNQPAKGIKYLAAARTMATADQNAFALAEIGLMEADVFRKQRDFGKALAAIDSCIAFFDTSNDPRRFQGMYLEKAKILYEVGKIDDAVKTIDQELALVKASNNLDIQAQCYQKLSEIAEKQGNFEAALDYYKQYALCNDSIHNNELNQKFAQEHTRQNIEAEQDARQKAELEAKLLSTQNRIFAIASISLLFLLLGGGYFFWKLRQSRQLLSIQNTQLHQLNLTKDKFFSIIAHDLRNPLSAFQGVADQFKYYLDKGDTARLYRTTDLIAKSSQTLNNLLDNLLSWALLNRGMIPYQPESLVLADEVLANIAIHENAAMAKSIYLNHHIPEGLTAHADKNALQATLRNLVSNAIKFTPLDGNVTVKAVQQDNQIMVSVSDTGIGFSADRISQVFELNKHSQSGTNGEKGAGLGLVLSKELVEINRGKIEVTSTEGHGATIRFTLPTA